MLHADLVLMNGNIVTMNYEHPKAQALAINDGKIAAIGTDKEILSYVGKKTREINLDRRTVFPGFIDSHVHGTALGRSLVQLDLRGIKSIGEIQEKVKQWATKTPKGQWIVGHGWDQDKLEERRYPSRRDLDEVVPENPVFLKRVCGHIGLVNSKALELAGITKDTKTPKAGLIDSSKAGEPNGILRENALDLILDILPKPDEKGLENICLLACRKMVEEGITTAHWIIASAKELLVLQKLENRGLLPLRIYALIPVSCLYKLVELGLTSGFGGDKIKIGSIKILADGSLGGRTAALKKPYDDDPSTKGMMLFSQKQLGRFVENAHQAGLQLAIHAIGDRTIEVALKALEKALQKTPKKHHRHRLEHVSVLNPELIDKMKLLGIVASVQPHFIVSDIWIRERLGEARAKWTYALKSLLKKGILTVGGSDAPIELVSPLLGVWAAVTREVFQQERLSVGEALRLYTVNAAQGSFEEDVKGSIEEGKFADLVVLSRDPYEIQPSQIKEIKVEMTIVGGNIVFARELGHVKV